MFACALIAGLLSGIPSTLWALLSGGDPLEASYAAGSILLGPEARDSGLLLAALPVHGALSLAWAAVLAPFLPRRHTAAWGLAAGAAIAVLDLLLIGRHFPLIAALAFVPQLADHLAFGLVVALTLRKRRSKNNVPPASDSMSSTSSP